MLNFTFTLGWFHFDSSYDKNELLLIFMQDLHTLFLLTLSYTKVCVNFTQNCINFTQNYVNFTQNCVNFQQIQMQLHKKIVEAFTQNSWYNSISLHNFTEEKLWKIPRWNFLLVKKWSFKVFCVGIFFGEFLSV
jgi:hypothetical protein